MTPRKNSSTALALLLSLTLAVSLLLPAGCATTTTGKTNPFKTVSVGEIEQMSQNKVPDDEIIKKIAESGTIYRLTPEQYADLRRAGVSERVMQYMQQTYQGAVHRQKAREDLRYWNPSGGYWYGGVPYGWW